jgi:ATP synthase protein I
VNLSDESFEPTGVAGEDSQLDGSATDTLLQSGNPSGFTVAYGGLPFLSAVSPPTQVPSLSEPSDSMQEFYQLYQELLLGTLALTAVTFVCVWIFYSLPIALNYLIGAYRCGYLRMLAKDVERLGSGKAAAKQNSLSFINWVNSTSIPVESTKIMPIFWDFLPTKPHSSSTQFGRHYLVTLKSRIIVECSKLSALFSS